MSPFNLGYYLSLFWLIFHFRASDRPSTTSFHSQRPLICTDLLLCRASSRPDDLYRVNRSGTVQASNRSIVHEYSYGWNCSNILNVVCLCGESFCRPSVNLVLFRNDDGGISTSSYMNAVDFLSSAFHFFPKYSYALMMASF